MDNALCELLLPLRERPQQTAVFLDFDGTLAPIVEDPASAVPIEGATAAIDRLANRFGVVAVVSGRPVQELRARLAISDGVRLRGLYGLQQWRNGTVSEEPRAAKWRSIVDEGATTAEAQLPKEVRVERKGMSFTLHFRRALEHEAVVEEWAARFANSSGLDARRARCSVEIGPFLDIDKGMVVTELTEGLCCACVLGDDAGDIPMFDAARRRSQSSKFITVNIAVESDEMPPELLERSDTSVDGPPGAMEVLDFLTG